MERKKGRGYGVQWCDAAARGLWSAASVCVCALKRTDESPIKHPTGVSWQLRPGRETHENEEQEEERVVRE